MMTLYVLRLSAAGRNGHPTRVELLGPFPSEVAAHDWSKHPQAGGDGTLRLTIVDLAEPVVPVVKPRVLW